MLNLDERRQLLAIFIDKVIVHRAKPGTERFDPTRVEIIWRMA